MASVSISVNQTQIDRMRRDLNPSQFKMAAYQAVKRTAARAVKLLREIVVERTYLKEKYAKRVIKSKVTRGDVPVGVVTVSQQLIPLVGYNFSVTKDGGAVVAVSKDKPVIRLRHGFYVKLQTEAQAAAGFTAHKGLALRLRHFPTKGPNINLKQGKSKQGFVWRYAIGEAFGPSVLNIIEVPAAMEEATEGIMDVLDHNVQSQLDRFTKGQPITEA